MSTEASGSSGGHSSPDMDAEADGPRSVQMPQSSYAAGWERLSAAFHSATARVEPGQVPPEAPPEAKEWAQNTIIGVLFGIMYGGGKQYLADRALGVPTPPPGLPSKLHEARYVADIQTNRLLGQLKASIRGGATIGGLAAIFYATQILSSIARGQRDHRDIMAAGLTTGGAFGILMPGGPGMRFRSAMLGAGIGGLAGLPIGLIQEKLVSVMPDEQKPALAKQPVAALQPGEAPAPDDSKSPPPYRVRSYDSTAAVIAQMEASLQRNRSQR